MIKSIIKRGRADLIGGLYADRKKGDFDIDKAIADLKSKAKNNMTDKQFSKCEHIIEKAVIRFSKAVTHTTTWANAFAVFKIYKNLIGRNMIHSLESFCRKALSYFIKGYFRKSME